MRASMNVLLVGVLLLSAGMVRAQEGAMSPEHMEAMQQAGSPGEAHTALEPLAGNWTYTLQMWMAPGAEPQMMTGTASNSMIFGGRFLKQKVQGAATDEFPAFEGLGFTGYDNLRKEYQSVWFDSMSTGMMTGTGQFDAATKTMTERGSFSCPMTGDAHRTFRATWTQVDADHTTYTSYMTTPDGTEYKGMEIHYTRTTSPGMPCPAGMDRC